MKTRNTDLYRASFTGLRLNAFGIPNTVNWTPEIEIYQARVSPELWRARPNLRHGTHLWEHSDRYALMAIINQDFVGIVKPWRAWNSKGHAIEDRLLKFHFDPSLKMG